jgi:hypothetical protein
MNRGRVALVLVGFVGWAAGCASPERPPVAPPALALSDPTTGDIAPIHQHKCGACHESPAPGTRTRETLSHAFQRHQRRVRLNDAQWAAMLDYLAARDVTAGPNATP